MSHSPRNHHRANRTTRSSQQARGNAKHSKQAPPDPWARAIGRAVGELCIEVGWTPEGLATKAGVSLDTIQRILGGEEIPYTKTYEVIHDAFIAEKGAERVKQVLDTVWAAAHVWPRMPAEEQPRGPTTSGVGGAAGPGFSFSPQSTISEHHEHHEHHEHVYTADPAPPTTSRRALLGRTGPLALGGLVALSSLAFVAEQLFFAPLPWIDGWKPVIVPYGSPGDHQGAIALLSPQTGEQKPVLTPDASRHYVSYPSCVWSASRKQLYYVATSDQGAHDLWYTRFGPGTQEIIPQPPEGWPQTFLPDRGPNCTSLGWTQDGQFLTYSGRDGKRVALNLDTRQEGTVLSSGSVKWTS